MAQEATVDRKNRVRIPQDIADSIGVKPGSKVAVVQKRGSLVILPLKRRGEKTELEKLNEILTARPRRTGKPENWGPREMKRIWKV